MLEYDFTTFEMQKVSFYQNQWAKSNDKMHCSGAVNFFLFSMMLK